MRLNASTGWGQIVASKLVKENIAARSNTESFRRGSDDGNFVDVNDVGCNDEGEEQRAVVDDDDGKGDADEVDDAGEEEEEVKSGVESRGYNCL